MGHSRRNPFSRNNRSTDKTTKYLLGFSIGIVSALYKAGKASGKNRRESYRPNDSDIIKQDPLLFFVTILSLFLAVIIPICGGSWWFFLIMPILGVIVLLLIEFIKEKLSDNKITHQTKPDINQKGALSNNKLDNILKDYIKKGQPLQAAQFYKFRKGVEFEEAKKYIDNLTLQINNKQKQ